MQRVTNAINFLFFSSNFPSQCLTLLSVHLNQDNQFKIRPCSPKTPAGLNSSACGRELEKQKPCSLFQIYLYCTFWWFDLAPLNLFVIERNLQQYVFACGYRQCYSDKINSGVNVGKIEKHVWCIAEYMQQLKAYCSITTLIIVAELV